MVGVEVGERGRSRSGGGSFVCLPRLKPNLLPCIPGLKRENNILCISEKKKHFVYISL